MNKISYILIIILFTFSGCRKFLQVDNPRDKVVANYAYNSENSAIAILTGLYYEIQKEYAQGVNGISLTCGATSDELHALPESGSYVYFVNNGGEGLWSKLYADVYKCNAAIEGLQKSEKLSHVVRNQLLGEAKFCRAFLYFYLVNLFGEVPLLVTTNYAENSKATRISTSEIYKQVKSDLLDAIQLLNSNYVSADVRTTTVERIRPNKATAQALLARVYLYTKDWVNAESMSTEVIHNPAYSLISDLDGVFLKNSKEAIWQLQPLSRDFDNNVIRNCADSRVFVLEGMPDNDRHPVWVSDWLKNDFEDGDNRYKKWVGQTSLEDNGVLLPTQYSYPYKYKLNQPEQAQEEYVMVFRIAEQYLIRSEAKIEGGNIAGGIEDLNLLRSNRSIGNLGTSDGLPLLSTTLDLIQARLAVEHERRIELFTEWGHRWLDLKRTGRINQVLSSLIPNKGDVPWQSFKKFFPTPADDRRLNSQLGQTPGWPE